MKWDAVLYQKRHGYVAEYGKSLLEYVACNPEQSILDLGCGTGTLTHALSQRAGRVVGIDSSKAMIAKARNLYPQLEFHAMNAFEMPWKDTFDIIFSNAVFHWIAKQNILLQKIYAALKNEGKLVCEFGASGNIAEIDSCFQWCLKEYWYTYSSSFFFPTAEKYGSMLEHAGFYVEYIKDYDRPTPLEDGEKGLENWLRQFFSAVLDTFSEVVRQKLLQAVADRAREKLWDGTRWVADYRRLLVVAVKMPKDNSEVRDASARGPYGCAGMGNVGNDIKFL